MVKNLILLSTFLIFFVIVSYGSAREISYNEVWNGDQFLQKPNYEQEKPAVKYPVLNDGTVSVDNLRETLSKLQINKDGKQQEPKELVADALCLIFGCSAEKTQSTLSDFTGSDYTKGSSDSASCTPIQVLTGNCYTNPGSGTAGGSTGGSVGSPESGSANCTPIQILSGNCVTNSGSGSAGGTVGSSGSGAASCTPIQVLTGNCYTNSESAPNVGSTSAGSPGSGSVTCTPIQIITGNCNSSGSTGSSNRGSISKHGFLSGTLEYAENYNLSMVTRTRRPTKFKKGKNCENKPKKHSQEIDFEDLSK